MPLPLGDGVTAKPSGRTRTSTAVPVARSPWGVPAAVRMSTAVSRRPDPAVLDHPRDPIHGADEFGHERRGRCRVEGRRRVHLLNATGAHDADPIGHGERLLLVVRDEQGGDLEPGLQYPDLLAQLDPDLGVERGEGLVEQEHAGFNGQGAGQGDTLLLAAGHLMGVLCASDSRPTISRT